MPSVMTENHFLLDGKIIEFVPGDNILQTAMRQGIEIPHFCYHSALGPLGACRLCSVEIFDEKHNRMRLEMACMVAAETGLQVHSQSPGCQRARKTVLELLMSNHPHDCPICDEGGECHLQNMTINSQHKMRSQFPLKRCFNNQDLGPLLKHEMNRCITCYRCTRFYQDYCGGSDLGSFRLRNEVYFGSYTGERLQSPFAGNLVEICPTGVFTDGVFHHQYKRCWDLQNHLSICPHCSVGCNITTASYKNTLRRIRNTYHEDINAYFICDRGRYAYTAINHSQRPRIAKCNGKTLDLHDALAQLSRDFTNSNKPWGILGSSRLDLRDILLLKDLAGQFKASYNNFSHELESQVHQACSTILSRQEHIPSLKEIAQADSILVIGDITSQAPMMDLAILQSLRNGNSMAVMHYRQTRLCQFTQNNWICHPRDMANRLTHHTCLSFLSKNAVIIVDVEMLNFQIIKQLQALQSQRPDVAIVFAFSHFNALGNTQLWDQQTNLIEQIETGKIDQLLVIANDPLGQGPEQAAWQRACNKLKQLVVLDYLPTNTYQQAQLQLPLTHYYEQANTVMNYEGRIQQSTAAVQAVDTLQLTQIYRAISHQDFNPDISSLIPGKLRHFSIDPKYATRAATTDQLTCVEHNSPYYDELGESSEVLATLLPKPCVQLGTDTAEKLNIKKLDQILIKSPIHEARLPVAIDTTLALDCISLERRQRLRFGLNIGDAVEIGGAS